MNSARTLRRYRFVALASLCVVAGAGCRKSSAPALPEQARVSTTPASRSEAETSDVDIRSAVLAELRKDPHIEAAGVTVESQKGVVALTGHVDNLLTLSRATRIAEAVRGVRAVSNRLTIAPTARPDKDVEADVGKALRYTAAAARLNIRASVTEGEATLHGTVGSEAEKQLVERVASGVRGVRSIHNDVQVKKPAKRDASIVAADVRSRLAWDALVEHDPITVSVDAERVKLEGSVGSVAERTRATTDAWVNGVSQVDASAIEVKPLDRPDGNLKVEWHKPDWQIAAAIKDAAQYDPRVRALNVTPIVQNGVVTLSGLVDTLQAKRAAEALARSTVGVVDVKNKLVARSQQPASDRTLERQLTEALVFDPLTDARDIHVVSQNGEVTLTGSVGNFFESAEAFDVAGRMSGVASIDDQLQVRDQVVPYVQSVWLDPYTPFGERWYLLDLRSARSDAEIRQQVAAELSWSPFVFADDVKVQVDHGKVTLLGAVHGFRERQAAVDAAFAAGATSVENQLTFL